MQEQKARGLHRKAPEPGFRLRVQLWSINYHGSGVKKLKSSGTHTWLPQHWISDSVKLTGPANL